MTKGGKEKPGFSTRNKTPKKEEELAPPEDQERGKGTILPPRNHAGRVTPKRKERANQSTCTIPTKKEGGKKNGSGHLVPTRES